MNGLMLSLKSVRIIRGFSLEEVAKQIGITQEEVERYEKDPGVMPAKIAYELRKLYGISLDLIQI